MIENNKDSNNKALTNQPEKVDRNTADRLNNYAQTLGDPITHIVDYGDLTDDTDKKHRKRNNA